MPQSIPSQPGSLKQVEEASEVVLRGVLRSVLWLWKEGEGDPKQAVPRAALSVGVLDPAYPIIIRRAKFPDEMGGFRIMTPSLMPRDLRPAFDAILSRKRPLGSLISWRRAVLDFAELLSGWQEALGPNHVLRNALARGTCEWCPF